MSDTKIIADILRYFRCNETQQKIYLYCLRQGRTTIKELGQTLNTNRVTVHSAVEELMKKGLLYETWLNQKRFIVAEGPGALEQLFEVKKAELRSAEVDLQHAMNTVQEIVENAGFRSRPSVKFYEGVVGFRKMLQETLQSKDFVYIIVSVEKFSEIVNTDYFLDYFARRAAKGIRTKVVYPECAFATAVFKRRREFNMEVHTLPAEIVWNAGVFSWNDSIALLSFSEQQQLTTTIIENRDIAHLFQTILFQYVMDKAKTFAQPKSRCKSVTKESATKD